MKRVLLQRCMTTFLFLAILLPGQQKLAAQSHALAANVNGTVYNLPVIYLPDLENFPFIGIHDLAEILDLRTYYSVKARKVILYVDHTEVKVTAMNPFVAIGDRIEQLPLESRYANGDIFVPLHYFLKIITPLYAGTVHLLEANGAAIPRVAVKSADELDHAKPAPVPPPKEAPIYVPNILGAKIDQKTNGTLIRIQTSKGFNDAHINSRVSQGWLYVDIYGGRVDPENFRVVTPGGAITKVVPVQLSQIAQLSFKLNGEITSRKVYADNNAHEILVSLATKDRVSEDVLKSLEDERRKWLIDTIIIDPGHGGRDPGAIGPSGTYEKDVVLAIGKNLKAYLAKRSDVRVIMTRDDDRFVPLKDRTRLANQEQGKLFISIHANSNRSSRVSGATTYFLGQAKTEEALEVSRRENSVINYETDKSSYEEFDTEGFILLMLAQNAYQQESQELAAMVQTELSKRAKIKDRGVKQAGYYVLIGASMPNILIEAAFISNRNDERSLKSSVFQKRVAEAIAESILKFKEKYEREI